MGNIPKDVAQLHAQTQDSRYQFLKMELLTCFNAIDFGKAELERGERELAATEIRNAKKGCATIRRFLAGLDSETQRNEIEAELSRLREVVDALRNKLGLGSSE